MLTRTGGKHHLLCTLSQGVRTVTVETIVSIALLSVYFVAVGVF